MAIKLCRHVEVLHKTTLLHGRLNSGFAVTDRRPSSVRGRKMLAYYGCGTGMGMGVLDHGYMRTRNGYVRRRSKCQDRVSSSFPSIVGVCLPCSK